MSNTAVTPKSRTRVVDGETLELVSLTRVGTHGWEWTIRRTDPAGGATERTRRTNGSGQGLWEGERQLTGTAQFAIPAQRAAAIRYLLRRR